MSDNLSGLEQSLQNVFEKVDKFDLPRLGDIVFNLVGQEPIRVEIREGLKSTIRRAPAIETPRLEITGDPERIQEVLDGKKDPRLAFLEGSMTVRGDIGYLQSVLRSLGLME